MASARGGVTPPPSLPPPGGAESPALPASRYSSWQLQDWLMDRELVDCGAKEALEPLKQAALLLQVNKKTEADAASISSLCSAISPTQVGHSLFRKLRPVSPFLSHSPFCQQIVKILSLYTPVADFEERVSPAFIAAVKVETALK